MKKYLISLLLPVILFFLPLLLVLGFFTANVSESGFTPQNEQERVAQQVASYVTTHGGTIEFASAWIGNMEHESGLIPSRIQSDRLYDETLAMNPSIGGYAMGLGQWDMGRRVNLLTLAKEEKKDWKTVGFQMDFAWNHDGADSTLLKNMSKHNDVEKLAVDILKLWERAGTKDDPVEQIKRKTSAMNWYKRLTSGSTANVGGGKIDVLESVLGQRINNGQCYGLTAYYVEKMGGPQLMNSGNWYASQIGEDYDWKSYHWTVIRNPKYEDVKAGDVINWAPGGAATSEYGHTGVVASVDGNGKFTTYEQNGIQGEIVAKYVRQWGKDFPITTSLVRKDVK
ncbi:phage tail tip lysozyme [Enterococcus faecalis]|uniref:phage tail tip lysozyme n=1 Tax=Enterococcus faecalis TaxID=1351 RepID=UPI0025B1A3D7|nr:phage tail tip lysozyme [Enterococcus faecalis]MDN3201708.1 phage tail tip lysozyme [Enterococcus faecalis]